MSKICHATEQIWNIFIKLFTTTFNTLTMLHTIVLFHIAIRVRGFWDFQRFGNSPSWENSQDHQNFNITFVVIDSLQRESEWEY